MTSPNANPDLSCPVCGDTFIVTGTHPCQRAEALASWAGCCVEPARTVRIQTPPAAPDPGKAGQREDHTSGADALPHPTRLSDRHVVPDTTAGGGAGGVAARLRDTAGRLLWWVVVPGAWVAFLAAHVAHAT